MKRHAGGVAALVVAFAATASPTVARAGRPLDTDDAAVVPRGSCQVESFARRVRAGGAAPALGDYGFAPSCDPFGWGEILLGGARAAVGDAASMKQGLIQLKAVPRSVSGSAPGWGIDLSAEEDFVKGRSRPAARLSSATAVASTPLVDKLQLDANLGRVHDWAPARQDRDHVFWGTALEWAVTPAFSLVGERTGTASRNRTTQIGLTFAATRQLTFDAALGRRALQDGNATFATVGMTFVSPAP